jgi:hypothetical protein
MCTISTGNPEACSLYCNVKIYTKQDNYSSVNHFFNAPNPNKLFIIICFYYDNFYLELSGF